jgi:hypothetical protein
MGSMSLDNNEAMVALLIMQLGGEATIGDREFEDARDLELTAWRDPANMATKFTAKIPKPPKTIAEVLAQHSDWTWSIEQAAAGCKGCDWKQELGPEEKAVGYFRQHQADMIESEGFTR